jgi:hypothetical protein
MIVNHEEAKMMLILIYVIFYYFSWNRFCVVMSLISDVMLCVADYSSLLCGIISWFTFWCEC